MKWRAESEKKEGISGLIVKDDKVGFYLYVFDHTRCIADYLEDSFDTAADTAEEIAGISRGNWMAE